MNRENSESLIKRKLRGTKPSASDIKRDLVTEICSSEEQTSLCIVGAAGAGKSTLMGQLFTSFQELGMTCSWLSFDARDNTPASFVAYLEAAINNLGASQHMPFAVPTDLNTSQALIAAVQALQQMISDLPANRILFLDDVHFLTESAVLDSLGYILDSCDGNLRVFIGSRTVPDLQMPRRMIQGQFQQISQAELNFSVSEAIRFFGQNSEFSLDTNEISALHKSTEGWAAGLQFATIYLKNSPHQKANLLSKISGRQADLSMYLVSNAFSIQPPEIQAFLLDTAALSSFNLELCRHVCSSENAAELLEKSRLSNLFLVRLDVAGDWYRYHHLFGDFLLGHCDKIHPGKSKTIRRQAASWCVQNNMPEDAIRYLLDCDDFDEAAKLIAEFGLRVSRDHGNLATILRWIEALPQSHRTHHPQMLVDHALALTFTHGGVEGRQLLEKMYDGLLGDPPQWKITDEQKTEILCYAGAVRLVSFAAGENAKMTLDQSEKWLADWPGASTVNLAIAHNARSYALMLQNNFDRAQKSNSLAQSLALRSDSSHVSIWADCIETMLLTAQGQLDSAEVCAARVLRRTAYEMVEQTPLTLMAHLLKAFVDYEKGDRKSAFEALSSGGEFAELYGPAEPLLIHFRLNAQKLREEDKLEDAIAILQKGFEIGVSNNLPRLSITLVADQISLLIEAGKLKQAQALCNKWELCTKSNNNLLGSDSIAHLGIQKRIAAELAIAEGDGKAALLLCESAVNQLRQTGRFRTLTRMGILKACALSMEGQTKKAWREISAVLRKAKEQNFVGSFFELQHLCLPLIKDIVAFRKEELGDERIELDTPEDWVLKKLQGNNELRAESVNERQPEIETHLNLPTERELDILRQAANGLSNAEIASTLLISVATVKWHMHNAFQKLDVKNRSAAIAKATRTGIL